MSILGLFKKIADCLKIHYTTIKKVVWKKGGGDTNWFFKTWPCGSRPGRASYVHPYVFRTHTQDHTANPQKVFWVFLWYPWGIMCRAKIFLSEKPGRIISQTILFQPQWNKNNRKIAIRNLGNLQTDCGLPENSLYYVQ